MCIQNLDDFAALKSLNVGGSKHKQPKANKCQQTNKNKCNAKRSKFYFNTILTN